MTNEPHTPPVKSEEAKPLTEEEIKKARQRSQLASMVDARVVRDLLATIDALKAARDREKERAEKAEGEAFAETAERIAFGARARAAERDEAQAKERADSLAAENVGLRHALDKIWHDVGAGFVRQEPYAGWAAAMEAALQAPETAKVRAVLDSARDLELWVRRKGGDKVRKAKDVNMDYTQGFADRLSRLYEAVRAWEANK